MIDMRTAIAVLLLVSASAAAQEAAPEDLSPLLEPIRRERGVPGLAGAIATPDGVLGWGAAGVRRQGGTDAAGRADLWHIGSCTKSMTATLVAILVERGQLAWDMKVAEFFEGKVEAIDPGWKAATLEQLLGHRAGVPSDLSGDGLWGRLWRREGTPSEQRMTLVRALLARPPLSEPGSAFLYANAGYTIAGQMAEAATGKPWEALLLEEVARPLGMTSVGFGAPGSADAIDQPRGHRIADGGELVPVEPGPDADNPAAIGPGGIVHCTIEDLARWAAFHAGRDPGEGSILSAASLGKLHTPLSGGDYALGWSLHERDWGGGRVLAHNGSNTMWFAVMWVAPEKGFAVVAATNVAGDAGARACDEVASTLIRHHLKDGK